MSEDPGVAAQITELVAIGRVLLDQGQLSEAESIFLGLRSIAADNFEVNKQLGIVLATRRAFAEAKAPLLDAAALDDSDPVVFNVLSACAFETGDYALALQAADRALFLRPAYPEAYNNRGNALMRLDRPQEAVEALATALRFTPRDEELHLNLGNAWEAMGELSEALASLEQAIALRPRFVTAHVNRGNILQRLGRHTEALQAYDQALALDPDNVDGNWNSALCRLLLGEHELGWIGYEARWRRVGAETKARPFTQPLWLGQESLQGRTILLHGEQGLGDTIQFARYVPKVAALGARVVLEVFAPLAELMTALAGVSQVIRRGDPFPPFDLHCPLMSLPLALGQFEPMPATEPYLKADPARVALWAERLGPAKGLRVGLVFSGSPTHVKDALRSIPFDAMAAALPAGPEYHLLQKDLREADREALAARPDVAIWADKLASFSDTAALIQHMDLAVSVDTSVAHLAGALGRPVWVLLPTEPDWRWGLERETTPWYPHMTLYRQMVYRDWSEPLERVAGDLTNAAPRWREDR
jgi:tetratricopeptide (TPR) repeat protein